ncbi:MAG: hypothetical protein ACOYJ2_00020 [Rickettsiales bacterium]
MRAILAALALMTLTVSACERPTPQAYFNRGGPESLIDVSSEVVNLTIQSDSELNDLSDWINRDQPTRAELYCTDGDPMCEEAKQVLDLYGVPTLLVPSGEQTVTLVYERILARDCEQRFIDNDNPYNLNHASFGCSIAANIVQHVPNKQQFVNPNLMDYPSAEKGVQAYENYRKPPEVRAPLSIDNSLTSAAGSQ